MATCTNARLPDGEASRADRLVCKESIAVERVVHANHGRRLKLSAGRPVEPAPSLAAKTLTEYWFFPVVEHEQGCSVHRAHRLDRLVEASILQPLVPHRRTTCVVSDAAAVLHCYHQGVRRGRRANVPGGGDIARVAARRGHDVAVGHMPHP